MNVPKERAQQSGAASSTAADVIPCPTCQHDAPATFRFCPECGTRLPFFRPQQIIEQKFQVVRLISQDGDTDVYEIRKLYDTDRQTTPSPSPQMSPNIAAAAVPVAAVPVTEAGTEKIDTAEIGAPAPVPYTAAPPAAPLTAAAGHPPATAATRDVSGQNRYNPLARKRPGIATILGILILAALVIWAVVIMMRPAPDTLAGERVATSTAQSGGEVNVIAEGTAGTVAPVVTLPPNIDPSAVSGEGSILQEVPVDAADIPLPTPAQQTAPTPVAQRPEPPPSAAEDGATISERRAVNILVSGVNRTDYYGLDHRCIGVGSSSFVNEGYTIELVSRACAGSNRPPGSLLGRWRVDAKTGEAYVQNADGKYVSP